MLNNSIHSISTFMHWSTLLNFIIHNSFHDGITICILQHKQFEFDISIDSLEMAKKFQFINIWRDSLNESFDGNVYDFNGKKENFFNSRGLEFDDLMLKLTVAIETSHCEAFVAFQADIALFCSVFHLAAKYSSWRSQRTFFLFAYSHDLLTYEEEVHDYFSDTLFADQPNILVVEAQFNSTKFDLKTNKFVGSLLDNPKELFLVNTYDTENDSFAQPFQVLYPYKLDNLYGREVVIGAFDYRPFVVIDYEKLPQTKDYALDNAQGTVHIDGAEPRLIITFCELYNCTVEADTSEKVEWGNTFDNGTGSGLMGMIIDRKIDMALGALYAWIVQYIDMSVFLGRSGITCLVPVPQRVTSWNLPLKPFQASLWLGVFTCLGLETLALLITYHAEIILVLRGADKNWSRSTHFGYMTTLKIFLSQSPDIDVISISVRTVLFSCFMIDIIITSVYGGGLASILTLPTLAEAADSTERLHKFGIPWVATSEDWIFVLEQSTEPLIRDLVHKYIIRSFDEMRELAKVEDMGFVLERMAFGHFGNVDFVTEEALDRLKLMIDDIYFQFTVALVPRLWPFLAKYDMLTYNWHSSGMDKFWEWRVSADFLNENQQEQIEASMKGVSDTGPVKLDMSNFAGLIVIWVVGTVLSILAFSMELAYWRYKNKQRKWREIIQVKAVEEL